MTRAAEAIVEAGGGLVSTQAGNVYAHRIDLRLPILVYDKHIERPQLVDVRARFTVET